MRDQAERDDQTVAIGAALGIFLGLVLAVGLAAWSLQLVSDVLDDRGDLITGVAVLVAGFAACSYLVRTARR